MLSKKTPVFAILLMLCLQLFYGCAKQEAPPINSTQDFIIEAQKVYQGEQFNRLGIQWNQAFSSTDGSRLNVPISWDISQDNEVKGERRLIIYKNTDGSINKVSIQEIIPTLNYYNKHGIRFIKASFEGTIGMYDMNMNFLKGQYCENGKVKYGAKIERFSSKDAYENTPKTEGCTWVQSSYKDTDGVFTVVSTQVCTTEPTQPNGDPRPTGPSIFEESDERPDGGGGNGTTSGKFEAALNKGRICGSYSLQKVGNSYSGSIDQVGFYVVNPTQGAMNFEFGSICVSIPEYKLSAIDASNKFVDAYNSSVDQILAELNEGVTPALGIVIQGRFLQILKDQLKLSVPGAAYSRGKCAGSLPSTIANYNCR